MHKIAQLTVYAAAVTALTVGAVRTTDLLDPPQHNLPPCAQEDGSGYC